MDDFILESKIRETLEKKSDEACADAFAARRIRAKVYQRLEEAEYMKKRNWKKMAVVTAAICVFGTMTALGIGKVVSFESSANPADAIQSFVAAQAKQESLDTQVKMVESFTNGYVFKEAVPMNETARDKDGNVTGTETTLYTVYEKDGENDLHVFSGRLSFGLPENPDAVKELEDGTELFYTSLVNKVVAEDYVITDEEKALQEAGKLNIAYDGRKGPEVDTSISSHVTWVQNGVTYSMMVMDGGLSAEEMFGMAQEIAESE